MIKRDVNVRVISPLDLSDANPSHLPVLLWQGKPKSSHVRAKWVACLSQAEKKGWASLCDIPLTTWQPHTRRTTDWEEERKEKVETNHRRETVFDDLCYLISKQLDLIEKLLRSALASLIWWSDHVGTNTGEWKGFFLGEKCAQQAGALEGENCYWWISVGHFDVICYLEKEVRPERNKARICHSTESIMSAVNFWIFNSTSDKTILVFDDEIKTLPSSWKLKFNQQPNGN